MLRTPSGRRNQRRPAEKINLIPILDSIFIFIFFLLMSASFLNIFEISSEAPIVSDSPPPPSKKKQLTLTIIIDSNKISVATGESGTISQSFPKISKDEYELTGLKQYLISLKKQYTKENTAILEPKIDLKYETLVKIMDTIRLLNSTDEDIYYTDKDGVSKKVETLFDNIIFGNILS